MIKTCGLQETLRTNLESQPKRFVYGKIKVVLKPQRPKEVIEDMYSSIQMTQQKNPQREKSSMLEYHPLNKGMILKDKLNSYNPNIQPLKLLKTLDQESISKDVDLSPFWNPSLETKYKQLWLPTKTDCVDLVSTYSNKSLNLLEHPWSSCQMMVSKSLSENLQKTSCRSLQFSQQDTMVPENIIYSQKIRIFPNKQQVILFNKCLGASRFFYNKANSIVKQKLQQKDYGILNIKKLRPLVMQSDKNVGKDMEWQKEVPYDTRQAAISDLITAYKTSLTKLKNGAIDYFDISYKTRKNNTSQTFKVCKDALDFDSMTIFTRRLKSKSKLRLDTNKLKNHNGEHDFIILKIEPKKWYICLPRDRQPIKKTKKYNSVFLDPGVRTFQTLYSPEGICGQIECGTLQKDLKKLADRHDKLQSLASKCNVSKTKRHIKQRCAKIRYKIKNKVSNLHWQTCSFLCNTFENIFISKFEVSRMVGGSPLGSKITRRMLELSHGEFRNKLIYQGRKTSTNIYLVNEAYSTKTCGVCGEINKNIGSSKHFKCSHCNHEIDRDIGAARNICLRFLTKMFV